MDALATTWRVEPATPQRWDDIAAVFGTRGMPSICWCQWLAGDCAWGAAGRAANPAGLRARVGRDDAPPAGVLAYREGVPAGWLRTGPLDDLPRLSGARSPRGQLLRTMPGAWMAACFVVRVGFRRQGASAALLDGAIGLARLHGAPALLGHPVDLAARDHVDATGLYVGALSTFTRAGFTEIARIRPDRPLVRLRLTGAEPA
ncbi:MAG: GNAT family N-acetyltransferase [Actinomycetia bacterium]|nr:GNAT family N-acetyltransferase [Actinomycetes bacterium]